MRKKNESAEGEGEYGAAHWDINVSHTTNGYVLVKLPCRVLRGGVLTNKAAPLRTATQVQ